MQEMIKVEKEVYEAVLRNSVRVIDLEVENQQLKELLKRCVPFVQACQYNYYRATPEQISSFLDRIDEMLGEKK